jgi:hypothetical protein
VTNDSGLMVGVSSTDCVGLCVPASVLPDSEASALSPNSNSASDDFTSRWPALSVVDLSTGLPDLA